MAITRLSGGTTPADGANPQTFPAIWNGTADDIEAGDYSKVPTGGADDAVLAKTSGADFATAWELRAAPWKPVSGRSYGAVGNTTVAATLNLAYFIPLYFPVATSVDGIRVEVTTAGTSTAVVRLGIYSPASGGGPGALVVDAGTVSTLTPTGIKSIAISQTVTGLVWLAAVTQSVTCTLRAASGNQIPYEVSLNTGAAALNARSVPTQSGVSGALPSTAAPDGTTGTTPVIHLAVP